MENKKTFGDKRFRTELFTGSVASMHGVKAVKYCIEPLMNIVAGLVQNKSLPGIDFDKDVSWNDVSQFIPWLLNGTSQAGIIDLFKGLDPAEFVEWMAGENGMLSKTDIWDDAKEEWSPVDFDIDFAGNVLLSFRLAYWIIQVNFPDFFALMGERNQDG